MVALASAALSFGCRLGVPHNGWRLYARLGTYYVSQGDALTLESFVDDSGGPVGGNLDMRGQARWRGGAGSRSDKGISDLLAISSPILIVTRPDGSRVLLDMKGKRLPDDADRKATWESPATDYGEGSPASIPVSSFSTGPGRYRLRLSVAAPTYGADTPRVLLFSPAQVVEVQ